jgi:cyclohexanone monooxygenase
VRSLFRRLPPTQRLFRETVYGIHELIQLGQRHPGVMRQVEHLVRAWMRTIVRDAELRRRVTPEFVLGCKRILPSNDYYPALTRENVELVAAGLREVRPQSVIDADGGEHDVDTIIFGTGFHATEPPIAKRLRGRDGRSLAEVWGGGIEAYLGTTVPGFPNGFIVLGPNLGNGHNSALVTVEAQLRYIIGALEVIERKGLSSIDVRADACAAWNAEVQEALAGTVWNSGGCSSWYLDAEGRNVAIYPWTTVDLRARLRRFDLSAYETHAAHSRFIRTRTTVPFPEERSSTRSQS